MRTVDIVRKKRDGRDLSPEEIAFMIHGHSAGKIPDYQMSAFLMAVYFRGMTKPELDTLTQEMRTSGAVIDLTDIPGRKVDKHSTGGVGDKTSLVVAPAVAAAGVVVPMISGRGLAHTGGTLDKLESIPGFNVRLSLDQFKQALASTGVAIIGATDDLVPSDRRLYALRDVTATVDSEPLIVASIMSKKLAEGIDGLVLDIKTGSGAFTREERKAEQLAQAMVNVGKACGLRSVALVTDMGQPLGEYVGNALEVMECLEILKGGGPPDLAYLCQELSAHCLVLGEVAASLDEGRALFREVISSGKALGKFREIVANQGGDPAVVEDRRVLPQARFQAPVGSPATGFVSSMNTEEIGWAMSVLGAGRETIASEIDPAVGMRLHKKIGDWVVEGKPLCTLFYNSEERRQQARKLLLECFSFTQVPPVRPALIKKVLS